jgi:hypothetical protein
MPFLTYLPSSKLSNSSTNQVTRVMSSISITTSLIPASTASRAIDAQSCTPATVYLNSAGAPIISDSVLPDSHQAVPDLSGEGKLAISYSVVSINQSSLKLERQYKGLPMVARGVGAIIVANEVLGQAREDD